MHRLEALEIGHRPCDQDALVFLGQCDLAVLPTHRLAFRYGGLPLRVAMIDQRRYPLQ